MNNLRLLIGKGKSFADCTEIVSKITCSGRKGAAPRNMTAVLMDAEDFSMGRFPLTCEDGNLAVFTVDGEEFFRGLIMDDTYGSTRLLTFKAFDNAIYLSNNKDSFSYKKKRADEIFRDCCNKLGLTIGEAENTGHVIQELIKKNTTYWDVIQDALSQTYRSTGRRYYVSSDRGKLYLLQRKANKIMPVLEPGVNIETYERSRSIESTRTRVKMVTSKDATKKSWVNNELEKKIGRFQEIISVDEKITQTELEKQLKVFQEEKGDLSRSLKVTGPGDISLVAGGCVYVKIPALDTERVFYIDEDTHVFENGSHKMTLKLNYAKTIAAAG